MSIPDFQAVMLPLLKQLADGRERLFRDLVEDIAREFRLTEAERRQLLPSGQQPLFTNRVGWARAYLKQAGLIESTRRAHSRITERGIALLREAPSELNIRALERYPEFLEFRSRTRQKPDETPVSLKTPRETVEELHEQLRTELARELLDQLGRSSPAFFERLVVDLLVRMGYGGSLKDAGSAIGGSGDEGIDGVIKEDRLGLEFVYVQAKRWKEPVSRPEIQKFVGALHGKRARKGVFITTSGFTDGARQFAEGLDLKVVLIDGDQLAGLMIDYEVGVSTVAQYRVKRIDSDYFAED